MHACECSCALLKTHSVCVFVTFHHPVAQVRVVKWSIYSSWRRKHWRLPLWRRLVEYHFEAYLKARAALLICLKRMPNCGFVHHLTAEVCAYLW